MPLGVPRPNRPEDVIATWREHANVLRWHGHKAQAESIERFADELVASMPDYLEWLSESEAMLRSGRRQPFFRARFAAWEAQGLAELRGRSRHYRQVVVPRRVNLDAVRGDAERAARAS